MRILVSIPTYYPEVGGQKSLNSLLRHKGWTWGFRTTILLYFVVLIVLPILGVYYNSFSLGFGNFVESVSDPIAWKSVLLTLKLAIFATLINVLLGTMIAWVLIRYQFAGKALLNSLVDLPLHCQQLSEV